MPYSLTEFGKLTQGQLFRFNMLEPARYIRRADILERPGYGLFTDQSGRARVCVLSHKVYHASQVA